MQFYMLSNLLQRFLNKIEWNQFSQLSNNCVVSVCTLNILYYFITYWHQFYLINLGEKNPPYKYEIVLLLMLSDLYRKTNNTDNKDEDKVKMYVTWSNLLNNSCFTSSFSTIASTIRSTFTPSSIFVETLILSLASATKLCAFAASSLYSFLATRPRLFWIDFFAFSSNSGCKSTIVTVCPACAATLNHRRI